MRSTGTAAHPATGDRGIPARAKLLAIATFVLVTAAVVAAIELVSPGAGWRYLEFWGIPVAVVYWPLALRLMRRVYGEQRVAAEERIDATRQAKYLRWFFRYLMPVVAVFFAFFGGVDAGPAWKAWHGQGTPGWAVAEVRECAKSCSWSGSFRSDDGKIVRHDVWIWTPAAGVRVGDKIRALDSGDRTAVFEASGTGAGQQWWLTMAFFVGGALYAAWWLGWITGLWRRLFQDGDELIALPANQAAA